MRLGINSVRGRRSNLPKAKFSRLDILDRYRRMCLGLSIKSSTMAAPYGYESVPDEYGMLQPIDEVFDLLVRSKEYLKKGYSATQVSDWLNTNSEQFTTRLMDSKSLMYIMKERPPFPEALLDIDVKENL